MNLVHVSVAFALVVVTTALSNRPHKQTCVAIRTTRLGVSVCVSLSLSLFRVRPRVSEPVGFGTRSRCLDRDGSILVLPAAPRVCYSAASSASLNRARDEHAVTCAKAVVSNEANWMTRNEASREGTLLFDSDLQTETGDGRFFLLLFSESPRTTTVVWAQGSKLY